jgi:transcriptional regulator with XRE-family HTH domain
MTFAPEEPRACVLLGKAVHDVRARHGLSRSDVAARTGFALEHIRRLEDGQINPALDAIFLLADAIGVPPSAFFYRIAELEQAGL